MNQGYKPHIELPNPTGPGVQTVQIPVPAQKCGLVIGKGKVEPSFVYYVVANNVIEFENFFFYYPLNFTTLWIFHGPYVHIHLHACY